MEEDEWDDALLVEITALETKHLQTHNQEKQVPNQALSTVSTNAISSLSCAWNCTSCTLQNDASRISCFVCATPRRRSHQTNTRGTDSAKKTVQSRLSFHGRPLTSMTIVPSLQQRQAHEENQQHVGCSKLLSFTVLNKEKTVKNNILQQTTIATGLKEVQSTSSQSGSTAGTSVGTKPVSRVLQKPRHATGEDSQAKLRYLDIETSSDFPVIDSEAAQHFVYPTNYSIRDYQLTIAEKALFHNTLVSLPTGLGKTLVAAVVMYNFYRWFPTGKIVFMAPTKPLVAQQIKACHEIMGIPLSDTAELQGNVPPAMRRMLWNSRRVFFCTPQSLQNDLKRGVCDAEKFVCIVVDEAHRATGNYAYCCAVQEIEAKTQFFRVLALSATPGAKFDVIQDVVTNLRISHIESRSADDPDVKKYTHARQEEVIICRLSAQITEVKTQFLKCFTPIVQRLFRGNIIQYNDPEKLTSWYVLQAREKFRKSPSYASNRSAESDLALLVSLLHAKSLLIGHGLSSFCDQIMNWVEERKRGKMSWSKREMLHSSDFQSLELSLAVTASSSSTASHPKLVKLREVLLEHFQRHVVGKSSTRAIVFTQYRASVSEIVALLRPLAPLLNVQPFIGQGASGKAKENKGQSQKVQQEIVRRFRLGEFNVLVATCIAEEGLDIGEVDLIVSFDALTSPVRMIQRMGRTGRKRVGRVIILVTEGDEQKKLARSASAAKTVSRALTTFKSKFTYSQCPRMLPPGICPQLRELEMKIPTFHASQVGGKTAWGTVDPNLWQLSDAERAVALTKYFPSNFVTSSRNKLCPIVANRTHLLRRQPRSLVRKGIGTRVGYSSRSLMLQAVVRKIHNIQDVLETGSDDDDDQSDDNRIEMGATDSSNMALSGSTEQNACRSSPSLDKDCRRVSVGANNADADGEVGSPWRYISTHSEFSDEGRPDGSFAAMNESVGLHFSPQFVDLGSQIASTVEESGKPERSITCHQENQVSAAAAANVQESLFNTSGLVCPSSTQTQLDVTNADSLCRVQSMPEGQRINSDDVDNKGRSQEMFAAFSLTRASDSPRPRPSSCENSCLPALVKQNDTTSDTDVPVAPRLRGMRQLLFDENDVDGNSLDQTQSAESSQQEVIAPAVETDLPLEKHELSQVKDEDHSGFSFALFPTNACTGGDIEDATNDTDQSDKKSSACSFALLPPTDTEYDVCTANKHSISAKLTNAAFHERDYQLVDDGTDGDGVDEVNEVKLAVKDELTCKANTDLSVVDIAAKGKCRTAVKHEEKTETRDSMMGFSKSHLAGINGTSQMSAQSLLKEAEAEQVGDDCCSICLESESCDEDPIVFCDGCNVAVHQYCYGISVVPSGKWFCDICAETRRSECTAEPNQRVCQLCPLHGGALKQTKCGKWVHVQCFLWIPEFRVEKSDDDVLVLGELSRLDPDRKTLDCSLCHSQKGYGIIQCAHKRCLAAFHVSCAAFARYRMDQLDPPDEEDTGCGTLFLAYCPLHRNSRALTIFSEQQKTPSSAMARSSKPPIPAVTETSSPSHLLTSPSSADAKKKFKTFRRLKRKYDATQSQLFSQLETKGSPSITSPWHKRIRRSKRRRETSCALAAAYIEDIADVRGGARSDDDDDDDYGDDYKEAADDSFINDSSQLLYSQSVESPDDADDNKSKKKRKKSSPNMRAIYARSLCESQDSPLLLRRGGRQLGALPYNGIIRACLSKLHNQPNEGDSPPRRSRSGSQMPQKVQGIVVTPSTLSTPIRARTVRTESDGDDSATEAEPSPSFTLLGAAKPFAQACSTLGPIEQEESDNVNTAEIKMVSPCYNFRGTTSPLAGAANTISIDANGPSVAQLGCAQPVEHVHDIRDAELHKKIEANRIKALKKLEERRQTKLQQTAQLSRPHDAPTLSDKDQKEVPLHRVADHGCAFVAATISKKTHEDETAAYQYALTTSSPNYVGEGFQRTVTTVDLTSPKPTRPESIEQDLSPKWVIFVSSSFARSSGFSTFLSAKHTDCNVVIDDTLEADALLSVRMAVLFLTGQELQDLALASSRDIMVKSRRIRTLVAMHKKIVVAGVYDGSDLPEVPRLKQLPNATVVVQPCFSSLCAQLHQLARQELVEGYEAPSPSLCHPDFSGGTCSELDADFASRLVFFRTIEPLSLDSALSLSFRFKNFAAGKVPVLKFNEMHWRRMLPWISESAAKEIRNYVNQNMHGIE
ncbi:hypothetical protein DD238_002342 [Peronospora effusa]|uniref:Fanconi anemia group M protein n=1 Tax=Peronospora effusa TaxID=542832 RepID=A0A3M6VI26_9STRA|nr:hypothetical protein DD238_002342 [Peronospora effusa]